MLDKAKKMRHVIVILASLFIAQQAQAHAHLKNAIPGDNSAVSASPEQLSLTFTEELEPAFSGITLENNSGKTIATGKITLDPSDKKHMIVPLTTPLEGGTYTVDWHALSVDGHKTKGQYHFIVK